MLKYCGFLVCFEAILLSVLLPLSHSSSFLSLLKIQAISIFHKMSKHLWPLIYLRFKLY